MSKIGKRLFRMINNEILFGDVEVVPNSHGDGEFLIRSPYTIKIDKMDPLMGIEVGEPANAVQIHPMNVVYQFPLSEFPNLEKQYTEVTTGIVTSSAPKIVL